MSTSTRSILVALGLASLGCSSAECPGSAQCSDGGPDVYVPSDGDNPLWVDGGTAMQMMWEECSPTGGSRLRLSFYESPFLGRCGSFPIAGPLDFIIHGPGATLPPTPGSVLTSTVASPNGTAYECPGNKPPCQMSETWTITFDSYTEGLGASGSYAITWEGGRISTGNFSAAWCDLGLLTCD